MVFIFWNNYNFYNYDTCKFCKQKSKIIKIKEKNPTNNKVKKGLHKLKKLYEEGLVTKKVLEEKQKEILK